MKTKNILFVCAALALIGIGGCDMFNGEIDQWWVGATPANVGGGAPSAQKAAISSYYVTFDMQGGEYFDAISGASKIRPQRVEIGDTSVYEPGLVIIDADNDNQHDTSPTKYFGGWWTASNGGGFKWEFDKTVVRADMADSNNEIKLYAAWKDNIGYTIKFEPGEYKDGSNPAVPITFWNGTNGDTIYAPESEYVTKDTELSEPKAFKLKDSPRPELSDCAFTGWYIDVDKNGIVGSGDRKWVFTDPVTETEDNADGTDDDEITLLAGWGKNTGGSVTQPENDAPVNIYTVTFNSDGGEDNASNLITPPPQKVLDGEKVPAPSAIHKNNYSFDGWYKDDNGNGVIDDSETKWDFTQTITNDMPLIAKWKLIPYTDPWFEKYFVVAKIIGPSNGDYFPFQCDTGDYDYGANTNPTELAKNDTHRDAVIKLLREHPTWVARIEGFKDSSTDSPSLVSKRELRTWYDLYEETGVKAEQLIINNMLPAGYPNSPGKSNEMIIGPNDDYNVEDSSPKDDEIRVTVYIPL